MGRLDANPRRPWRRAKSGRVAPAGPAADSRLLPARPGNGPTSSVTRPRMQKGADRLGDARAVTGHLPPGEADHLVSENLEPGVTRAILFERGSGAMGLPAVDLDDEQLIGPDEVDHVPIHPQFTAGFEDDGADRGRASASRDPSGRDPSRSGPRPAGVGTRPRGGPRRTGLGRGGRADPRASWPGW